jgi:putative adhesin
VNEHDREHEADEERARDDEERGRDDERDARRDQRSAEREARRAEREARRAERHAFRAGIREEIRMHMGSEWGDLRGQALGDRIRQEVRKSVRRGLSLGLIGGDEPPPGGGPASSELVERHFTVAGMPRLTVRNVAGETEITVGEAGDVFVRARKRVSGWSEDRAKRLFENVEVRMEQSGDDILVEPRLFEQERGWLDLFRGGRVAVDLDIRVPREAQIDVTTVSGEVSVTGTRGPLEVRSVSGEINVDDVQGPLRMKSVSGDIDATAYAGQLEANSVSGDVRFERSRVRTPDIVTVSGDVDVDAVATPRDAPEGRIKTVSGDVDIAFVDPDVEVDFRTTSGDAQVEGPAKVEKEGRRDRRIVIGGGTAHLRVKTISGDLCCRSTGANGGAPPSAEAEEAIPMAPPAAAAAPASPPSTVARDVLDRLARGELSVDDAAAALDAARSRGTSPETGR